MKKEKYENFIIYKFEDITPPNIQISSKILLPKNLSENIYINIEDLETKDISSSMSLTIKNKEILILNFSFDKNKDYNYPIIILNDLFRLVNYPHLHFI